MFKTEEELSAERAEVQEQILAELQKQNEQPKQLTSFEKRRNAIAELMNKPDHTAEKQREALTEAYANRNK